MQEAGDVDLGILDPGENVGYGPLPIPCARDEEIASALRRLEARWQADERRAIQGDRADVVLAFAERMASLAVRRRDEGFLGLGLVAVAMLGTDRVDAREVLLVLPLFDHGARLLGLDPARLFGRVAARLGGAGGLVLEAFAARKDEDRRIEATGYVEGSDDGGFRYRRTW